MLAAPGIVVPLGEAPGAGPGFGSGSGAGVGAGALPPDAEFEGSDVIPTTLRAGHAGLVILNHAKKRPPVNRRAV